MLAWRCQNSGSEGLGRAGLAARPHARTLSLTSSAMKFMFVTCSVAILATQSLLLFRAALQRIDQHWVAATFAGAGVASVLREVAVRDDEIPINSQTAVTQRDLLP